MYIKLLNYNDCSPFILEMTLIWIQIVNTQNIVIDNIYFVSYLFNAPFSCNDYLLFVFWFHNIEHN